MIRSSKIKRKWARNEPVLVTQLHLTDPSVHELASLMGFDGIWLDMEHHGYSLETAQHLMRAARVGSSDVVARPAKGEFMRMQRMLESGAQGIMYPRCRDAAEAAEVVRWAKFAPLGQRGMDGAGADAPYCMMPVADYVTRANQETFVIIQLEEPKAVEQAEDIARVNGVDAIMLGPADFSLFCGIPGQMDHQLIKDASRRIANAAKAAGKIWGQPSPSPQHTQQLLEMGAKLIFHMADIVMVKNGLEKIQKDFGPVGFTFNE
jgi:4-hydroxy-2-oxoheptanedioate aldolase